MRFSRTSGLYKGGLMNDDKITCMYFDKRFTDKPQGSTIGWVQKNLGLTDIAIEDLANGLCNGASFKPGVFADVR